MGVNGKQKGAGFEREICKKLSLWITKGEKVDCFWRSAMSGGRATVAKGAVRQAGDITAVAPEGHALTDVLYIECKNYKDVDLDCLVKGKGTLLTFWKTAQKEAAKYNRIPTLIFKRNHWPIMFCTSREGIRLLKIKPSISYHNGNLHMWPLDELLKQPFLGLPATPIK